MAVQNAQARVIAALGKAARCIWDMCGRFPSQVLSSCSPNLDMTSSKPVRVRDAVGRFDAELSIFYSSSDGLCEDSLRSKVSELLAIPAHVLVCSSLDTVDVNSHLFVERMVKIDACSLPGTRKSLHCFSELKCACCGDGMSDRALAWSHMASECGGMKTSGGCDECGWNEDLCTRCLVEDEKRRRCILCLVDAAFSGGIASAHRREGPTEKWASNIWYFRDGWGEVETAAGGSEALAAQVLD